MSEFHTTTDSLREELASTYKVLNLNTQLLARAEARIRDLQTKLRDAEREIEQLKSQQTK